MNILTIRREATAMSLAAFDANGDTLERIAARRYTLLDQNAPSDEQTLDMFLDGLGEAYQFDLIAFHASHGGTLGPGIVSIGPQALLAVQRHADLAPRENLKQLALMRLAEQRFPAADRCAVFDTGFHRTIPLSRQSYGLPKQWGEDLGIRRYGDHGVVHRQVAETMSELAPDCPRVMSLHLDTRGSACGIDAGQSISCSTGLTGASGVLHLDAVGEIDPAALVRLSSRGCDGDYAIQALSEGAGVRSLAGRDEPFDQIVAAADGGDDQARLAVDAYVEAWRHTVGGLIATLAGPDAIVFSGSIGLGHPKLRQRILADLDFAGIEIDRYKNTGAQFDQPTRLDTGSDSQNTQIWAMPTDPSLTVANLAWQWSQQGEN